MMETWLPIFVGVITLAVLLQMAILLAMFLEFRRLSERTTRIASELQSRINPILNRLQVLIEDTQPRLTGIVVDASEVAHLARSQAQKVDRIFTEAVDRLRLQLIRADQILAGALEAIEDTGSKVRRSVWGPVHQASAFIKGVKTGLDVLRGRPPERSNEQPDEGLFI